MSTALKRRRLGDLYVVGKEVTVDDGQGEPITVYLRKLNLNDQEDALRRANAARSRILASVKNPDSVTYQSVQGEAVDMDRDSIIEQLVAVDLAERVQSIEAELAAEDEWKNDDYLQGLQDAWAEEMQRRYLADNKDEEAKRVFEELQRYVAIVAEKSDEAETYLRAEYFDVSDEVLREKITELMIKNEAARGWIREFRRCEVFFATRTSKVGVRYFQSRDEIDELDIKVFSVLLDAYRDLTVEPDQGKSLPPTEPSSPPSVTPVVPAMDEPSGPQIVSLS